MALASKTGKESSSLLELLKTIPFNPESRDATVFTPFHPKSFDLSFKNPLKPFSANKPDDLDLNTVTVTGRMKTHINYDLMKQVDLVQLHKQESISDMLRKMQEESFLMLARRAVPQITVTRMHDSIEMDVETKPKKQKVTTPSVDVLRNASYVLAQQRSFPTLWSTNYYSRGDRGGSNRGTTLYARDRAEAEELCRLRGMHEKLADYQHASVPTLTSVHLRNRAWEQAAHACVWLCMIAASAKIVDSVALLMDDGLIHEMAHIVQAARLDGNQPEIIDGLIRRVEELERITPGMWPVFSSEHPDVVERETGSFFGGTRTAFTSRDLSAYGIEPKEKYRIQYALGHAIFLP